jgi:hypothetical protein
MLASRRRRLVAPTKGVQGIANYHAFGKTLLVCFRTIPDAVEDRLHSDGYRRRGFLIWQVSRADDPSTAVD